MMARKHNFRKRGVFTRRLGLILSVVLGLIMLVAALVLIFRKEAKGPRILIFNREEFASHPESRQAVAEEVAAICSENGMQPVVTDDPEIFTDAQLSSFAAIVFANTSGDVLNLQQEEAFKRFIQAGGGFVGTHAAMDTEHNWAWYHLLLGASFDGKTGEQEAVLTAPDPRFEATKHLKETWVVEEDWFNFRDIEPDIQVVLLLDEYSFQGGSMGAWHPAAWYRNFDGGRAFYTTLGHSIAIFKDADFRRHLLGGIRYAVGNHKPLDYRRIKKQAAGQLASSAGFVKTSVACNLAEPMELDIFPNGDILFIERLGTIKLFKRAKGSTDAVGRLEVYPENEQGLLGLAIDPGWTTNHWIYLFYAPVGRPVLRLSRFDFRDDRLWPETEKIMLEVDVTRDAPTFHCGGSLEFDHTGNLYVSIGDNTNNYNEGFVSLDERPGKYSYDSQRSAGNSMDLRGKILRIRPMPDGSYVCPAGNLFTNRDVHLTPFQGSLLKDRLWLDFFHPHNRRHDILDDLYGRPEIYIMGVRNPFRISLDSRRGALYWGDIGPDAGFDDEQRGPEGYDEFNAAQSAGFFGWPYFIGNNRPYRDFDFEAKTSGDWFNPRRVENTSVNNSGARRLPYPMPALIWYPFRSTELFPEVGNGTRCVMAGPVYYADQYPDTTRFPEMYDGHVIMFDWMRCWLLAVDIDSLCRYKGMKPLAVNLRFSRPMDMLFDSQGALWVLEYGNEWYNVNPDACLSRIDFKPGESNEPASVLNTSVLHWDVGSKNRSFFRPGDLLPYRLIVTNPNAGDINLAIEHIQDCPSPAALMRTFRPALPDKNTVARGETLVKNSDCSGCHDLKRQVNGPSYQAIAQRYQNDRGAADRLAKKIKLGGGGVWGQHKMSAHPQLPDQDVQDMVRWILDQSGPIKTPPLQGRHALSSRGAYVLYASYRNEEHKTLVLHEPMLQAEYADKRSPGLSIGKIAGKPDIYLRGLLPGAYFCFEQLDLRHVKSVQVGIGPAGAAAGYTLELHRQRPDGPLLGKVPLTAENRRPVILLDDTAPADFCDLYFVLKKDGAVSAARLDVDWVEFNVIEP